MFRLLRFSIVSTNLFDSSSSHSNIETTNSERIETTNSERIETTNSERIETTNSRTLTLRNAKMTNSILDNLSLPAKGEIEAAVRGQRDLAAYLSTKVETQKIAIQDADNVTHHIELPTSSLKLLEAILGELALGNAVQVVPVHAELTTQEAANILNVSRPHMVKLLEEGQLPFHKTGRHRRVLFANLMQYKDKRDKESNSAMQELADLSQDLGLY